MARLVRARVKAVEDLPEWAKCCEEVVVAIQQAGEMTLDLARVKPSTDGECGFCGAEWPEGRWAPDISDGLFTDLELVDLDEGEYTVGPEV